MIEFIYKARNPEVLDGTITYGYTLGGSDYIPIPQLYDIVVLQLECDAVPMRYVVKDRVWKIVEDVVTIILELSR